MMINRKYAFVLFLMLPFYFLNAQSGWVEKYMIDEAYKNKIISLAKQAMIEKPITVTNESSPRSAGGKHDFFSEGDYWWENPASPDSPYIQRDGMSNPNNFVAHRKAMIRFSQLVGTLTSAYLIEKKKEYAEQAFKHYEAWFLNEETLMNPSLLYAQAIKGRVTGRGVGIIDMIQMIEVAQSLRVIEKALPGKKKEIAGVKSWFEQYLSWVTTHPYGIDERNAKNNHGTCWVMQVAAFARLTGNKALLDTCENRFKTILLPNQMDENGAFPLELRRTKPYGYALFNADAMATICHILADRSLWTFSLPDGRNMEKGISFMYPFVADKNKWTYPKDVMYWDEWPVAQPFLLFGSIAFKNKTWLDTWGTLERFPENEEVIRNLPIRNPLIWLKM
ncbi:MAG: alginate lyase family protein [Saprospiraceae bacterium]|nr:alginate lyase family protein [Saprospiraceae bacterium]MDP4853783.1 alginate lyase family protein [Saprospiraceae bacterium]MDP4913494.1 alginate lyase family protein [Saprospiraceae bacterium]